MKRPWPKPAPPSHLMATTPPTLLQLHPAQRKCEGRGRGAHMLVKYDCCVGVQPSGPTRKVPWVGQTSWHMKLCAGPRHRSQSRTDRGRGGMCRAHCSEAEMESRRRPEPLFMSSMRLDSGLARPSSLPHSSGLRRSGFQLILG